MNNTEIYEALLVTFDKVGGENVQTQVPQKITTKTLEFTMVKTIDCVIDEKRGHAIDLETGEVYHIINYVANLIISPDELDKIMENKLVVRRYEKKNMDKMSQIYKLFLKSRANKRYKEYLDNIKSIEGSQKVKKIGAKKRGKN